MFIACNCSAVQWISAFLRPCFRLKKKFPLKKIESQKNVLGPFRISAASLHSCSGASYQGYIYRLLEEACAGHCGAPHPTWLRDMWWLNVEIHSKKTFLKNAWNWELWPSEEVREEEGKKERVGLHICKIAEPGIVYCTVCDRMIYYTITGKDALTIDWSNITDWMDAIKYHEVLSF